MTSILAVFPPSVTARLEEVERRLLRQAASRDERLANWTRDSLASGGKRVRPLLLLTAFEACGGDALGGKAAEQALDSAVALELVHTASLVHDDIMDEAAERRGQPSTYAAHGRDGAILVGDYIFTQAFALAATLPKDAMAITADACRRLVEGQIREAGLLASKAADREAYRQVIRDKTASLLSAGCAIGAVMARAPPEQVAALQRYGEHIGCAFQVLDDLLDVSGDPDWTGKPAGTDYVAGVLTSPYLNFLGRGGTIPDRREAKDFPGIRRRLFESGAVAESQLEASGYTQAALMDLEALPASVARDGLERLAELLMERAQ
jgi:heptaprenyl diphosphate synthase